MRASFVAISMIAWWASGACADILGDEREPLYDPDPKHLWNEINDTLFVRTSADGARYGSGRLDILYWDTTKHLLSGPSHEAAIRILDQFIKRRGERLVREPLKRALLQRDLWELFDWTAAGSEFPRERTALQGRLAIAIRRLALSQDEISSLPDNHATTATLHDSIGFPQGLFDANGAWLTVGANRFDPTALTHVADFGGRSTFFVMARFPQGRQQAVAYLKQLHDFDRPLLYAHVGEHRQMLSVDPSVPQFPIDTQWALVRRLNVIDQRGDIRPTRLIESIQLRRYLEIPSPTAGYVDPALTQQRCEFVMDRRHGGILKPSDRDFAFVQFRSLGVDLLETADGKPRSGNNLQVDVLRTCSQCHGAAGILSVLSYNRLSFAAMPIQLLESSSAEHEFESTLAWKRRRFDWGLLQGLSKQR